MDPLAAPLACACVKGYAQRQYGALGQFLEQQLKRPVLVDYDESLVNAAKANSNVVHLIIGKRSVVFSDAAKLHLPVRPIAMLTDPSGSTELCGLFVVRASDPARSLRDLRGRRVVFGPKSSEEKHDAALAALRAEGVEIKEPIEQREACSEAALELADGKTDAAVISGYARPLLEACGTVDKGSLRVIGQTPPVPFVTAFVTERVSPEEEAAILAALQAVAKHRSLLKKMESQKGFAPLERPDGGSARLAAGWPDWRGRDRSGFSRDVPATLPDAPALLWKQELTGQGLSGPTLSDRYLLVSDRDIADRRDLWRCLEANTGREIWKLEYPAAGKLDFSSAPRASAVIRDGCVFLLGAYGHLHCVRLDNGKVIWKRNLISDFHAELTAWGCSATPLLAGNKLVVNPGAPAASLVALDAGSGKLLWQTPGEPAAYASFILARLGGVDQIVGFDSISLNGWNPDNGQRIWRVVPPAEGDFNVPSPVIADGQLAVVTENNGARLFAFDHAGCATPKPVAVFNHLASDTVSPIVMDGLLLGCSAGKYYALNLRDGLRALWQIEDPVFEDHVSLIAGNGRVLVLGQGGELLLLNAARGSGSIICRVKLFTDPKTEIWSHPALVRTRLYVRTQNAVACFSLGKEQ